MALRKATATAGKIAAISVPLVGGILVARLISPALPQISSWVASAGYLAPMAFVLAYTAVVVLMLPAFLLIIVGGAVFGAAYGTVLSLIGALVGGTAAFLISRHVARERVERWTAHNPRMAVIDKSVGQDGARIVFLLRLSPAIPFVLSNYALGVTQVRLTHFALGTFGLLPTMLAYAAYGAAVGTGSSGSGKAALPPTVLWLGVAATVVLAVVLARIAQNALRVEAAESSIT